MHIRGLMRTLHQVHMNANKITLLNVHKGIPPPTRTQAHVFSHDFVCVCVYVYTYIHTYIVRTHKAPTYTQTL